MADLIPGTASPVVLPSGPQAQQEHPLDVVRTITELKRQEREAGQRELSFLMDVTRQGVAPPAAAFEKAAKKAGFDISAFVGQGANATGTTGAVTPPMSPNAVAAAGKAAAGPPAGAQAGVQVSPAAANAAPAGGQQPQVIGTPTLQAGVAQAPKNWTEWAQQAQAQFMQKAQTEGLQQSVTQHLLGQQSAAIEKYGRTGDAYDLGAMMQLLGHPVDAKTLQMMSAGATPEGRAKLIDLALGGMTDYERAESRNKLLTNQDFMSTFKNPADAERAVDALVHAQPIPADINANRQQSTEERFKRGSLFTQLANTYGASPKVTAAMTDLAMAGGNPTDILPDSYKPIALRQLEAQQEYQKGEIGLRQQQVQLEYAQALAASKRVDLELAKEKNDALRRDWELALKDPNLSEGMKELIIGKVAATMGGRVQETTGLLRRIMRFASAYSGMGPEGLPFTGRKFEIVPGGMSMEDVQRLGLTPQQIQQIGPSLGLTPEQIQAFVNNMQFVGPQQGAPGAAAVQPSFPIQAPPVAAPGRRPRRFSGEELGGRR